MPAARDMDNAGAPADVRGQRRVAPDTRNAPAPPARATCTPSAREPLGDAVELGVVPGDRILSLDDITRSKPGDTGQDWLEVERITQPDLELVALERPGDAAALVMLAPVDDARCVQAVWGFSFGGLGVELTISDVARAAQGTRLIALEALATFNEPADSTSDPTDPRRIVLAIADARAAIVADTAQQGTFGPYADHHWYFAEPTELHPKEPHVVATDGHSSRSWRFDASSWKLVPVQQRKP